MKFRRHLASGELPDWKHNALDTFSEWLAALPDDAPPVDDDLPPPDPGVGLVDLADALTALARETKALARSSDQSRRELESFLASAREQTGPDAAALEERRKARASDQERREREDLLCDVADACESLSIARGSLAELDNASPATGGWFRGRRRREARPAGAPAVDIPLRKLQDILRRHGVEAIARAGESFDAATMRAAGLSNGGEVAAGAVSDVIRQGYRVRGQVIMPAEVMVEKECET